MFEVGTAFCRLQGALIGSGLTSQRLEAGMGSRAVGQAPLSGGMWTCQGPIGSKRC